MRHAKEGSQGVELALERGDGMALSVPAWMTERAACDVHTEGPSQVSLNALFALRDALVARERDADEIGPASTDLGRSDGEGRCEGGILAEVAAA